MKLFTNKSGFTLVELSIVLVIIGLLIGGVLVGQSLIETAKLRNVTRALTEYNHVISLFENKYKYLPGDYPNAVAHLAASNDGNGDRVLDSRYLASPREYLFVFDHLTKAKLINEARFGKPSTTGSHIIVGGNTPEFKEFEELGMVFVEGGALCGGTCVEVGGRPNTTGSHHDTLWGGGLNAIQTLSIDSKIDDGKPYLGSFRSIDANHQSAFNENQSCISGSDYIISEESGCVSWLFYIPFGY